MGLHGGQVSRGGGAPALLFHQGNAGEVLEEAQLLLRVRKHGQQVRVSLNQYIYIDQGRRFWFFFFTGSRF